MLCAIIFLLNIFLWDIVASVLLVWLNQEVFHCIQYNNTLHLTPPQKKKKKIRNYCLEEFLKEQAEIISL